MKKILHLGKYYFPSSGGIESVTYSLANSMSKSENWDVTVLCFANGVKSDVCKINGVKVVRCSQFAKVASQSLSLSYIWKSIQHSRNADLVHLHTPNMVAAICVPLLSKVPLVIHWHSDVIKKGLLGVLAAPLEYLILKRAAAIVVTSQAYALASNSLARWLHKVKVVPIGIEDLKNKKQRQSIPFDLEQKIANRKVVLSVGRLVGYKGFETLIESAKYLQHDAVILIVGSGPLKEKLLKKIVAEGVGDRVYMIGRLESGVLQSLFERAKIFCLSSNNRAEAFGVVLLEAMTFAKPIVSSKIVGSGVPWVNEDGVSGLNFSVGDSVALAKACNQILESEDLWLKLSVGARKRYEDMFTEAVFIKSVENIYSEILNSKA